MSEYVNTEAAWQEVAGPEATPWSPTPGSDAHPMPGSPPDPGVQDSPLQIDISRIRDDFEQTLNQGTDYMNVPVRSVTGDTVTGQATVPVSWSDSRKREQRQRLQRWDLAQDRLGAGIVADQAAELRRELEELTEEGRRYARQLLMIPGTEEDASTYSKDSYSHLLDDLDIRRHRGEGSWTKRVEALRQKLEAHEALLDMSGYDVARQFYMRNPHAAERARDQLFGSEEIELPPEVQVPEIEPLEMNLLVHRTQKMVNEREKVRRALAERDALRLSEADLIDTTKWTAFKSRS